jgi:DNA (cytosine-5)-methyltransferase 1
MHSALLKLETPTLAEQIQLLEAVDAQNGDLPDELARLGWSYDDFIYEVSGPQVWSGRSPLALGDIKSAVQDVPLVSFFTGCGGMDLGFESVGYKHVAAFEINELFCKTLRRNRPDWTVFGPPVHDGDVSRFDDVALALRTVIKAPFEGVFAGGPPCQPFSIAANQRFAKWGDKFKRTGFAHEKNGNLLFDYIKLIIEFRPKAFVIENVPGLRDLDGGEQLQLAIADLRGAGYTVAEPRVLDAAQHGIPQQRLRLFVVGSRGAGGDYRPPAPLDYTVGSGSVLFNSTAGVPNNETRGHRAGSLLRYMRLKYGARDQLGRVDRLDPKLPSKTVIAGGTAGGGRSHLHPEIPRTLSVRECARLQTFPDNYVFVGASARQFTQVGNAVPPVVAAHVGKAMAEAFF